MKKSTKRILALLAATALAFSLSACAGESENDGTVSSEIPEGKLFAPGTELSMALAYDATWPFKPDWKIVEYFQEETGATLNVSAIPSTDFGSKLPLIMANPKEMPDMIHAYLKTQVTPYVSSGAFVSYTDNMDKMPNLQAFINSLPETEKEDLINQRLSGDGEMYYPPTYGNHRMQNLCTWLYRKDVFEEHNLKVPTTYEEMYQVAKELKKLYPNSYPICFRNGNLKFIFTLPAWKNDFSYWIYYDYVTEEWKFGSQDPLFKEVIQFYNKLVAEELVPPDFMSIDTKVWEELMSSDRGFITMDYIVRIDFFNNTLREVDPDYTLAMMAPPIPDVPTGQSKLAKTNIELSGWTICNTGKEQNINNAFKLVDWMYSPEGVEILSWGKEGETYEVVDGKKKFIVSPGEDAQTKYGFFTRGMYQLVDEQAFESTYTEENIVATTETQKYLEERSNPELWLPFTEEEETRKAAISDGLKAYCEENITKFLLGMQPMSEWDNFQKGLIEMGVEEFIQLHEQAYARISK